MVHLYLKNIRVKHNVNKVAYKSLVGINIFLMSSNVFLNKHEKYTKSWGWKLNNSVVRSGK